MITTRQWVNVFRDLDQWDVVSKLLNMHLSANASTSATGLSRPCSPNVAHRWSTRKTQCNCFTIPTTTRTTDSTEGRTKYGRFQGDQAWLTLSQSAPVTFNTNRGSTGLVGCPCLRGILRTTY
jgi:hypothetical protein